MLKLDRWLGQQGFAVRRADSSDSVDVGKKVVHLRDNKSRSRLSLLYSALHLCGHVVVNNLRDSAPKVRTAGATRSQFDKSRRRTLTERLSVMEEEMVAWTEGEALAKSLGIRLGKVAQRRSFRARLLAKRLKWCSDASRSKIFGSDFASSQKRRRSVGACRIQKFGLKRA
jgi:hypothetical protein